MAFPGGESRGANVGERSSIPMIVLVFDMDQTLIDTNKDSGIAMNDNTKIPSLLNTRLLEEVISPAVRLRNQGRTIAILLLTNNGDEGYIQAVMSEINNRISDLHIRSDLQAQDKIKNFNQYLKEGARPVFDAYMSRNTPGRVGKGPEKRLEDVESMLGTAGLSYDPAGLVLNTYMFDDMPDHVIKSQIPPENYFYIVSKRGEGFTLDGGDATDYSVIKRRMESLKPSENIGYASNKLGGRRRRSLRRRNKKSKKTKKRSTRTLRRLGRSMKLRQVKQHGGGLYCPKRVDGKFVDYVYCAAECDADNTCGPYT
jgi:hypothetical protein